MGPLDRVAAEEPVRRPVRADAVPGPERLEGRLADPDAAGLEQVVGQLGVGPVGPVEPVLRGTVDDPLPEDRGQVGGELGPRPGCLPGAEAVESAVEVGAEPPLDGPRGGAGVGRHVRVAAAPVGHPDDLDPVPQPGVGRLAEGLVQAMQVIVR